MSKQRKQRIMTLCYDVWCMDETLPSSTARHQV